jgi:hypothetical protein
VAQTKIKIHARFATPEDTARALGVPMRRVRKLIKLIDSYRSLKKAGLSDKKALRKLDKTSAFENVPAISRNGSRQQSESGPLKRKTAQRRFGSGKKRARVKISKASR